MMVLETYNIVTTVMESAIAIVLTWRQVAAGADFVVMEDPELRATSPTLRMMSHFTGLVKLALDLVRQQRQQQRQQAPAPAAGQRG